MFWYTYVIIKNEFLFVGIFRFRNELVFECRSSIEWFIQSVDSLLTPKMWQDVGVESQQRPAPQLFRQSKQQRSSSRPCDLAPQTATPCSRRGGGHLFVFSVRERFKPHRTRSPDWSKRIRDKRLHQKKAISCIEGE